jgi:hypothetical protein
VFQDDEVVKTISTRFVPVAVDQHIHRKLKDAEGELFARVLRQAGRGLDGYSQGVYLFTADGKLLAFSNTADAGQVRRLMDSALKKFAPAEVAGVEEVKAAPVLPEPPQGGLVVAVATKVMGGYDPQDKSTERFRNSVGRDHLWLRPDEAAALARGELPDSVQRRLVRYHLIDNTRGEPSMWREDEVRKLDLSLRDGRISGTVHLETKAGDRGYQADLLGFVEVRDGKVVRLDLVFRGQFWGESAFARGAPKGKFPLVVTFALVEGKAAADRIPPQAARGNTSGYLR